MSGEINMSKHIYKLVHYFYGDPNEHATFVEMPISSIEEMVNILGALSFKFEELIDEAIAPDLPHYADLLEKYYGCRNITEQCQVYLEPTQLSKDKWDIANIFNLTVDGHPYKTITQIDLYQARESCCGPGYDELMNKNLPKDKEFESDIEKLKPYYLDTGGSII